MTSTCCAALAQLPALLTCSTPNRHTHKGRPLQVRGCREQGWGAAVGALRVRPGGAAGRGARRLAGRAGVRCPPWPAARPLGRGPSRAVCCRAYQGWRLLQAFHHNRTTRVPPVHMSMRRVHLLL